MSKNTIKKIILTIVLLSVLILSLTFFYRITSENHTDNITIVKKIISEKYEDVVYFDNSNCLYAYSNNQYTVYDYNGNRLYTFGNVSKDNIIAISKKYYIIKKDNYHLYNINNEEIASGDNIYYVSDNLAFVDNNIISVKGEILFYNIKNIKSYYKNKYFLIDNYFVNEKGKVLLVDYEIRKEKRINNELDYFIVKKNNMYYCFFPIVDTIIGEGFDGYFEYNEKIYILADNKIFEISTNGIRREITFVIDKNIDKKKLDYSKAVRKNRILTKRDYYLGLLETDTNKFYRIMKAKNYSYTYIDNNHINILADNKNYVYDLENKKIVYSNNFDDIVIFANNYKTLKINNKYYLLDDDDRRITTSNKQIILLDSKAKVGKINKKISLYDYKELYDGEKININENIYYKYQKDDISYIVSKNLKEKYKSDSYLNYMNNTIVELKEDKINFYNKKKNKTYTYDIKDYKIANDSIYKNALILSNDKDIIVLGEKGNLIKKIKNVKLESISFSKTKGSIIVIVEKDKLFNKYKGAYVLK